MRELQRMSTSGVAHYQTARARFRIGKSFVAGAKIELTPMGMLSVAALVSSTLLSSAILVMTVLRARH